MLQTGLEKLVQDYCDQEGANRREALRDIIVEVHHLATEDELSWPHLTRTAEEIYADETYDEKRKPAITIAEGGTWYAALLAERPPPWQYDADPTTQAGCRVDYIKDMNGEVVVSSSDNWAIIQALWAWYEDLPTTLKLRK